MDKKELERPPHRWVADKMGYSIAGISLLRSGHRSPTISTMEAVEVAFGWPMCDQIEARGYYAEALETVITETYDREKKA